MRAANQRAADVAAQSIDQCINSATVELSRLYVDPTIAKLHNTQNSLSSREVYNIYECMEKLASITVSNAATEDYLLFIPELSCMVSYRMCYTFGSNALGKLVYNPDYEALRTELINNTASGSHAVGGDEQSIYLVLLTRDFSSSPSESISRLAVCAKLDMEYILKILYAASDVVQIPFALMGADDTILCATEGFSMDTDYQVTAPLEGAAQKVVACVPQEVVEARIRKAIMFPITVVLLSLLLILALCYSLTKVLYRPLRRVLLYAQTYEELFNPFPLPVPHRDELSQIQYALCDARARTQELSHSVEHYSNLAFHDFFRNLYEGTYHDEDFIRSEFDRYGIVMNQPFFLVHILKAEAPSFTHDAAENVQAFISDVLSHYLNSIADEVEFITIIEKECVIILYNLSCEHIPAGLTDCCHAITERLNELANHTDEVPERYIYGCGELWKGVTGIVESFREAKKALEQDIFSTDTETVFFAKNNPIPQFDAYRMTRDDERIITETLRCGDGVSAVLRMRLIVEDNARTGNSDHIEFILTQLLTLPLRLLRECGYCPSDVLGQPDNVLFQTLRSPTKLSYRVSQLTMCYEQTANHFKQQSVKLPLSEESLIHFLEENHMHDCAVSEAAAAFGMSVSYFSASIKRLTGQTFIEKLNGYRVARAVEMLKEPEGKMTLNEISERVGFQNYRTFARAFSREMNVSPESYRREIQNNPDNLS